MSILKWIFQKKKKDVVYSYTKMTKSWSKLCQDNFAEILSFMSPRTLMTLRGLSHDNIFMKILKEGNALVPSLTRLYNAYGFILSEKNKKKLFGKGKIPKKNQKIDLKTLEEGNVFEMFQTLVGMLTGGAKKDFLGRYFKDHYFDAKKKPRIMKLRKDKGEVLRQYNTYKKEPYDSSKVVFIGHDGIGKTCLMYTLSGTEDLFKKDAYIPTVADNLTLKVKNCSGNHLEIYLWDTAGLEEYDRLRPLSYSQTKMFVFGFSVDNFKSVMMLRKYIQEVVNDHGYRSAKFVMVGMKVDLREEHSSMMSRKDCEDLANILKPDYYCEVSSKERIGIKNFEYILTNEVVETYVKK